MDHNDFQWNWYHNHVEIFYDIFES